MEKLKHIPKRTWALVAIITAFVIVIIGIIVFINLDKVSSSATVTYSAVGFEPSTLKILISADGTGVDFINNTAQKVIIAQDAPPEMSAIYVELDPGAQKNVVFTASGIYTYFDQANASNNGSIEVITLPQQ